MNCASCAHEIPDSAKFCPECGTRVARQCATCSTELLPGAKFCAECGAPVAAEPAAASAPPTAATSDTRKVVTIVFADLVGSTALHERLDPESARRFMESYYTAMRGAVEAHGGTVTQLLGDGVKAVFGIPRVAEDDAIRAVRAAVAMQEAFRALAEQQRGAVGATGLRVAVNTGEVVANDASEIIGDPVNVAARLQEQGRDGDVVIGDSTEQLVAALVTLEPLGSFSLKGRAEQVAAYRVESLEPPEGATTAAFVGRVEELARITTVYDDAVRKPAASLALLLGSPGLGKSRLIEEFARRLGDTATVVTAHCVEASGASFAPLASALREVLGVDAAASAAAIRAAIGEAAPGDAAERARITDSIEALLAASPAAPEETFFVVRRLLAGLAERRPVVLVIDDLQWAEPLLLDLVEHLVQWGSDVPLLLLVGARPELRDVRSSLVMPGGLASDVLTLAGLDAQAAMQLAANVVGASDLPSAVAAKVLATSEGNPLFVGELVRMLVHEGALTRDGDRWIPGVALAALEMPPTIHALLAARIERLGAEERAVLERAAVVGRHFSRSAVAALLPGEAGDLDARLESLLRSELIERDAGWLLGEPGLRFHHVLIRDAAYRRILKGTRADLHARFADWVEAHADDPVEHDETIGWHLEQAHQLMGELGPLDDAGRALGERASKHLAAAGRRALGRDDVPLAASLLGRALARLEREDPARAELALDWCEALLASGDVSPAANAIDELGRFTAGSDRLRAWHTCFASQHTVLTAPEALDATADAVAAAAESLAAQGDGAGEAKAHFVHALALQRLGRVGACEAALDKALAAARRADDRRRANTVLAIAPLAALWGPSPVTRASGRCLDVVRVLRISQSAPAVEAVALSCQGVLEALRGRTDAARRMIASAREMVEELGITHRLLEADVFAGRVELIEGDATAAERWLRGAYEGLRDGGLGIDAAQAAALLARALLAQDRVDEAEALSHESETLAGDDLAAAIAWRGVRAEALARRGEHDAAVEFASQAVEIAEATDALLDHADARLALAAALRSAGRDREADAEDRRARELWETKGASLLTERAPREVTAAEPAPRAPAPRAAAAQCAVAPNAATAMLEDFFERLAAREFGAVRSLFAEGLQELDHPTGTWLGRDEVMASLESLFRSHDASFELDPLATLGSSLVLTRRRSRASGTGGRRFDVGEYEHEALHLIEVDEAGLMCRAEVFAADRLDHATVRLYERYAELLPDPAERAPATAAAQSLAAMLGAADDLDRLARSLAPDFESRDHRQLSTWSGRGAQAFLEQMRALLEVADDVVLRTHELLALRPNALLVVRMHSGTDRLGGGAYERPLLLLLLMRADGRLARAEWFDAGHEAEALARFEGLTSGAHAEGTSRRRVRANAATRNLERQLAALQAGDVDALMVALSEDLEVTHHPWGRTLELADNAASFRWLFETRNPTWTQEPLATLGDSLVLVRRANASDGIGEGESGAAELEVFIASEVDERERARWAEVFAADRLRDAVGRLYERYAEQLPDGPERTRARVIARRFEDLGGSDTDSRAPGAIAASLDPTVAWVDHRLVGAGVLRGPEAVVSAVRALADLSEELRFRLDDVLALSGDATLLRVTNFGTTHGGGAFEREICVLRRFGDEGRITNWEIFEGEQEVDALARFDALAGGSDGLSSSPFANAATRLNERFAQAWAARDWDAVSSLHDTRCDFDDRRPLMQLQSDLSDTARTLFEVPNGRWNITPLATRGERLALSRVVFEGDVPEGGGELAIDYLNLDEVDGDGQLRSVVMFDPDDLDAAYAELDRRFEAVEGAEIAAGDPASAPFENHATRAFARGTVALQARDWEGFGELFADDFRSLDRVSHLESGRAEWLAGFREMVELTSSLTTEVLATRGEHLALVRNLWRGGEGDVGPSEVDWLLIIEADEQAMHRVLVTMRYPDDRDAAFAELDERFAEGEGAEHSRVSATLGAIRHAWQTRDWDALAQQCAPGFAYRDHRLLGFGTELGDAAAWARSQQVLIELAPDSRTRTDHVRLCGRGFFRQLTQLGTRDGGAFEIPLFPVAEVDEQGRIKCFDVYDLDKIDRARAHFDSLRAAGPRRRFGSAACRMHERMVACWRSRDWDDFGECAAADFRFSDRRAMSQLEMDREQWIAFTREIGEIGDTRSRRLDPEVLATRGDRLCLARIRQTVEGGDVGPSEIEFLDVSKLDDAGLLSELSRFDPDALDAAYAELDARFREIGASVAHGRKTAIGRPNSATDAGKLWQAAYEACAESDDWERVLALHAPSFVFDDRRRLALLSGGIELMIASARERAATGAHIDFGWIGTAGERVALSRILWAGGPADGRFEIEYVLVTEVDDDGLIAAFVLFDLEDTRLAQQEAWARWAAIDPSAGPATHALGEQLEAFNAQDPVRYRAIFADDLIVDDHRHAGMGRIEGADAYIATLVALWELAPETRIEAGLHWPALGRHSFVADVRRTGTVPGGGGGFESEYLNVGTLGNGLVTHTELFETGDLDEALARFEEIEASGAGRSSIELGRSNQATEVIDRFIRAINARDFDALNHLIAPDVRWDDRQQFVQLTGDASTFLSSVRERVNAGAFAESHVEALAGERVAIFRTIWSGGPSDGRFEMSNLSVIEVEGGLVTAAIILDANQRREAQREAWSRWVAIDPSAELATRIMGEQRDAFAEHDRARFRAQYHDECSTEDHRHAGMGRLEGADAYVDSITTLWDLAPESVAEVGWPCLVVAPHGFIVPVRRIGRLAEGGDYVSESLNVYRVEGRRIAHAEFFEMEDLDAALARFEELRPDPLRVPPNAATRIYDRWFDLVQRGDVEAVASLYDPAYQLDDRGRLTQVRHGVDGEIANARFIHEGGWRPERTPLATAGDRLALQRVVWIVSEGDARSEIHQLELDEVGPNGLCVRIVLFEPEDRAAASAELFERWVESGAEGISRGEVEFLSGLCEHDLVRARAALCDDFVLDDRRRTGLGRIEGPDAYLRSVAAVYELTSNWRADYLYPVAAAPHGSVWVFRSSGTNTEGGAFESIYLALALYRGEQIVSYETYELEDLDTAVARLEERRPDPSCIPPNAATRSQQIDGRDFSSFDLADCRRITSDDFQFEDRGRRALVKGGVETWFSSFEFIRSEATGRVEAELLGTVGDRVSLHRDVWSEASGGTGFEIVRVRVTEVDAAGQCRAIVLFDPEDRATAFAEAHARFLAGEAAGNAAQLAIEEFWRAWGEQDWDSARAQLSEAAVIHDHRPLGWGRLGRDEWIESWRVGVELAPDIRTESTRILAWNDRGRAWLNRLYGTRDGGEFEIVAIGVGVMRADGTWDIEFFDVEDAERALARFEELCTPGS